MATSKTALTVNLLIQTFPDLYIVPLQPARIVSGVTTLDWVVRPVDVSAMVNDVTISCYYIAVSVVCTSKQRFVASAVAN